jgi:hypothetical protein
MRVLAPEERLPAVMPVMKITAPPAASWIGNQLAVCADIKSNEVFLIVPGTTAQTRSLRTIFTVINQSL